MVKTVLENKDKYIVIREVIRKKNPQLLRWMPRFVLRYIERVVHEDDINQVMDHIGHLHGLAFVDALIDELGVIVELKGEENIPREGGVIFASNHPLGGLDGVAFMHALGRYRQDIKFIVNDILMNIKNLQPLFVGVNKHGTQGRQGMKQIEEAYAQDQALLVFPAGLVSRKRKGKIEDLEWKKSFIGKAKKYRKDIVPVYIDGRNSAFFYNFARFRESIGIKTNVEMFYLADEMFAQKNKKVTICVGKPISYTYFDGSKSEKEWAEEIKQTVYDLAPEN
ncbi:glycerol acyltransferase [Parapedobacter pyrenivorans]|uniref:Glycerol acyltransferase n=1 Tax=Parapedobacter pyrenivorans TaxID=1305674 RepID=A0A917I360_9SPHI|nr:1-acyl-sn-glycerol-3-phosphate acyltransferase [Parapedobacter pyrenivorans]GGH05432.1 glycerol acyltransferase [Parapedobacter pyrenivorans]